MTDTGGKELARRLIGTAERAQALVEEALEEAAQDVLRDQQALTPVDPSRPGPHVRDALTILATLENGRPGVRVGLPTADLANVFFWFRFLDAGTAGGTVTYRRRGSDKQHTMTVPARPALHILNNSLDANRDKIVAAVRAALDRALKG